MNHSPELLKGSLQTIVLKVLADFGKMYGYEIVQHVKKLSAGTINLTEGALYPTLHRMEKQGFLKTEIVMVGKRMRKYYKITPAGKQNVDNKVENFVSFVKTMSAVLSLKSLSQAS
jgi:PadR family transcriptional regulator, regulatory protein PadR